MAEEAEGDEYVYNAQMEAQLVPKLEEKSQPDKEGQLRKQAKTTQQQKQQQQQQRQQQQLQEPPTPVTKSHLDPHGDHFRLYEVNQKK